MDELLRTSLLWRLFAALAALYHRTFLPRMFAAIHRAFAESLPGRALRRLLGGQPAVERSAYRRLMDRGNAWLCGIGAHVVPVLEDSLAYRIYRRVMAALRNSLLLGWLFAGGMTGFLLFLFSSYAIVDYLLRDVLQLAAIASVWDELLMLFSLVWVIHRRVDTRRPLSSTANGIGLWIAFYLTVGVLLLMTVRPAPTVNFTGFRASMEYLAVFYLVTHLIRDERDFREMYLTMVIIATVLALHGIWQFIIGVPIPASWTDAAEGAVRTRVYSIFSNPNIMGAYMILFAPMTIGLAYACERPSQKVLFWLCGLAMCAGCLFTMSRGAWLALAAAAVLFALLIDRRLLALMLVCGAVACTLPFVRSRIGYLFTPQFADSNARGGRAKRWATAIGYLKATDPVFGMGYGMYGGAVAVKNPVLPWVEYMYVDNYYVKILTENGVVGVTAFGMMLLGLIGNGLRGCVRTAKTRWSPLCAGMLCGLVGVLIHSVFESIWEEPYMMALFFAVAAMMAWAGLLRRRAPEAA